MATLQGIDTAEWLEHLTAEQEFAGPPVCRFGAKNICLMKRFVSHSDYVIATQQIQLWKMSEDGCVLTEGAKLMAPFLFAFVRRAQGQLRGTGTAEGHRDS